LDNINTVEYLQPVNTEGLLQKVRAAIFLSLDELWPVSSDIMLIATFLDPRFKNFDWCNGDNKDETKELVQELYDDAKKELPRNSINSDISSSDDDDNIFKVLKGKERNVKDVDEVVLYLQQKQIRLKDDPLKWWSVNKTTLPILAQIARKYLSIPAASVPSERLFSDAGNHISARRTRLSPELVNKMLFLKRNSDVFDIFPPLN
jgi:hAT family C-terminal dimerisation region